MAEKAKLKRPRDPWARPQPTAYVTLAIKGVASGTANAEQQKAAMKWIVEDLCRTYDLSYRPNSDRDTAFAEGKRSVGLVLVEEININPAYLRSKTDG